MSGAEGWTVRKASHNQSNSTYLVEKAILKLLPETPESFSLHERGVTVGKYTIQGQAFDMALDSIIITSFELPDLQAKSSQL